MKTGLWRLVAGAMFLCCGLAALAQAQAPIPTPAPAAAKIYPPSAQLASWPMQVFVSRDLPAEAKPTLSLLMGHAVISKDRAHCDAIPAAHVARNQLWTGGAAIDGQVSEHTGTLLLFHLDEANCVLPWFKPVIRTNLKLTWLQNGAPCAECTLLSPASVLIGQAPAAIGCAIGVLLLFTGALLLVVLICRCSAVGFFLTDGRLSLAMVQMALWTYAVGFIVLYELFVRLDAADIPASLIVLMTASLLTAGVSATLNGPAAPGEAAQPDVVVGTPPAPPPAPEPEHKPIRTRLLELFTLPTDPADGSKLSLSRAQMLFWTAVIIMMFVSKSLLSEELWDVPWALVALMGVSQLGYLGGKYGYAPRAPA
jgi:hypothetical protein